MKFLRFVDRYLEEVFCTLLLLGMTVSIFMQILFRAFGAPLGWTEEFARYLFVWLIYISCSFAVRMQSHIKVDVLSLVVKRRGQLVLDIISNIVFFLFAVIIAYYGSQAVYKLMFVRPQISAGMKLPMWLPYLAIPVGTALMSIRLVQVTVLRVAAYLKEPQAGAHMEGGAG